MCADLLEGHITLELESIDRLYLNGYVPQLQHGPGLVGFLLSAPWTTDRLACVTGADHRKIRC